MNVLVVANAGCLWGIETWSGKLGKSGTLRLLSGYRLLSCGARPLSYGYRPLSCGYRPLLCGAFSCCHVDLSLCIKTDSCRCLVIMKSRQRQATLINVLW